VIVLPYRIISSILSYKTVFYKKYCLAASKFGEVQDEWKILLRGGEKFLSSITVYNWND